MNIAREFRSVIDWQNPDPKYLFYRWTDDGDEIKNASKLIVGPGQGCIFVYEGRVEAVYDEEGVVALSTDNIPFFTTIRSFMQKFESHHKVSLFFFKKAHILNQRWGTPSPIKYDDPKYNFPVGLGAFGNYSVQIMDAKNFFRNVVAGADTYTMPELQRLFLSRITQPMSDFLAKAKFSYAEIDSHREDIVSAVHEAVIPIFEELGFKVTDFRIEGTNFDEDTQTRIGRIADMSAEGQAARAAGIDYVQLQQLEAMKNASKNEGISGFGMQMGLGMEMGKMLSNQPSTPSQTSNADPTEAITNKLKKLKSLYENELISEEEYQQKKQELLDQL